MSDDPMPDLSLLARRQRQLLAEVGSIRDDIAVLTAIVMRQDGTLGALLNEVRRCTRDTAASPPGYGSSNHTLEQ